MRLPKTLILAVFLTAGCNQPATHPVQSKQAASGDWSLPYGKWSFSFITPWQLPAEVSLVRVLDTDGRLYTFRTLDQTSRDPDSVTSWTEWPHGGSVNFNNVKMPPQYMIFCWDSFIDKKTYETSVMFSPIIWLRMKTPAAHVRRNGEPIWYRNMLFGLSPGGKVRTWFPDINDYPAIAFTPYKINTVSGADLTICKNGADSDFLRNYRYSQEIQDSLKGKTYPYGEW